MNRRVTALVVAAVVALLAALALFPARSHADVPAVASREALVFEPVRTAGPLASGQALIPAVRQVPTPSPSLPPVPRMAAVRGSGTPQRGQAVGSAASTTGQASWYCGAGSRCTIGHPGGMYAAAGPALRVGDWRGTVVTVTANGYAVRVQLIDWCACTGGRVLDLYGDAFAHLAPLSQGVVKVTVTP